MTRCSGVTGCDGRGHLVRTNVPHVHGHHPSADEWHLHHARRRLQRRQRHDILYRPGAGSDIVSYGQSNRTFFEPAMPGVSGTYSPTIGRFDGSAKSDLTLTTVSSDAPLGVGDFDGDGVDDVLLSAGLQTTRIFGKKWTD